MPVATAALGTGTTVVVKRYIYGVNGEPYSASSRGCRATDVDCDGVVGALDLIKVRNAFATAVATGTPEDVCDGQGGGPDGNVDDADLICVRDELGLGIGGLYTELTEPPADPIAQNYAAPARSFTLHGLPYDQATSLVFARARYYHPKLDRWMSRDPKGYLDGGNLYEAFGSNPARYTDPMGTVLEELFNLWNSGKYASYDELVLQR